MIAELQQKSEYQERENNGDEASRPRQMCVLDRDKLVWAWCFAARVQIHLSRGNVSAARRVIDAAEAELQKPLPDVSEETCLSEFLDVRTSNTLANFRGFSPRLRMSFPRGIVTLGDLSRCSVDDLLSIPNIGEGTVRQIADAVGGAT